jgi:hypothetical protein
MESTQADLPRTRSAHEVSVEQPYYFPAGIVLLLRKHLSPLAAALWHAAIQEGETGRARPLPKQTRRQLMD